MIIQGDVEGLKFAAFYTKGEEVLAVATMGKDPVATKVAELLRLGRMPTASEIKGGKVGDLVERRGSERGGVRRSWTHPLLAMFMQDVLEVSTHN